jgi:hypothetical protein
MVRLYVLLFIVQIALAVAALISCLSTDEGDVRALPRFAWILIILFFPLVGSIAWFLAGRPATAGRRRTWGPGKGFPESERPRPVAPDDDPEFLKGLHDESKADQEMFEKWEQDLRRREGELRRKNDEEKPES